MGTRKTIFVVADPQNPEAEAALLASVLFDPGCLGSFELAPGAMYLEKHAWILEAMQTLAARGTPIELITLAAELEAMKRLDQIGGTKYLTDLYNSVPTAANAKTYARLIQEAWIRRRLLQASQRLSEIGFDGKGQSSLELAAQAEIILKELRAEATSLQGDPWPVFTLADAYQERAPLEYLVEGIIAEASLNATYGAPGTLKTLCGQSMVVSVASGKPWLTHLPDGKTGGLKTKQAAAMWIDFDNGQRRTDERLAALSRALNLPKDLPLFYYCMPSPWLDANSVDAMHALADRIKSRSVKLVGIDNLRVVSGSVDENSGEMARVMSGFRWLAEETGAAINLIHHQRKLSGIAARAGDGLRGHSSIEAALDLALHVEREDHSDLITISATKVRNADILPFGALFAFEHKPGTRELNKARFFGRTITDETSDRAVAKAIVEVVTERRSINQTELVKAVKLALPQIGMNRIRDLAERLAAGHQITSTTGKHGSKLYGAL